MSEINKFYSIIIDRCHLSSEFKTETLSCYFIVAIPFSNEPLINQLEFFLLKLLKSIE